MSLSDMRTLHLYEAMSTVLLCYDVLAAAYLCAYTAWKSGVQKCCILANAQLI